MEPAPTTNPLRLVATFSAIMLVSDAFQLMSHHTMSFVGYTRVALILLFLIFYLLKHQFAWHVAVAGGPLIAAVFLFLYFTGGHIYRPPAHARQIMVMWVVGEVIVLAVALTYLARVREPYFLYVSRSRSSTI